MNVGMNSYYRRINEYGYTPEEAYHCPKGMPIWMYRIEQAEGKDMPTLLREASRAARATGYTMRDLATEWGVNHSTLQHWADKWGIHFPRGASYLQKQAAAKNAHAINARRRSA